jgi:hypothetical protein
MQLHICKQSLHDNATHVYVCIELRSILPLLVFYLRILPSDTLRYFNVSLFFGVNIIISRLINIVKERPLPQFYILWCCNIAYRWPKLSAEACRV